jgi:O-acetyl-ADP-ribose deacetylase (regulator of RNase III)
MTLRAMQAHSTTPAVGAIVHAAHDVLLRHAGGRSIGVPAIPAGIHGCPLDQATRIAGATLREESRSDQSVIFTCFDQPMLDLHEKELGA